MEQGKRKRGKIEKIEVPSMYLGKGRTVRICLPAADDPLGGNRWESVQKARYPVVYCQDGEQFFNFGRIATLAHRLITEKTLPPFAIVGVDADPDERTAEYAPDGRRFQEYTAFFTDEMMPYIEQNYPVSRELSRRIVAGDSLGATVSLHLALDSPHLFRKVLSLSGAFLQTTRDRIRMERDLRWLELYMLVGTDETAVRTDRGQFDFLRENRETFRLLAERGARIAYEEKPGEHKWGFWQQHLEHALKAAFQAIDV